MERGAVWLVTLPSEGGREQAGQRPAVVIQDPVYGGGSPLVLAVSLTSQSAATRFPATVSIDPDSSNGLTVRSVAMVFQTRALDRARFIRPLGTLSHPDLQAILDDLNKLTGQAPG